MQSFQVIGHHKENITHSKEDRIAWSASLDRSFWQWFVAKHCRKTQTCFHSSKKRCVVNVYERYKCNLKNQSKRNFDVMGSDEARSFFLQWLHANDIDLYMMQHTEHYSSVYSDYKKQLYTRYKHRSRQSRSDSKLKLKHAAPLKSSTSRKK